MLVAQSHHVTSIKWCQVKIAYKKTGTISKVQKIRKLKKEKKNSTIFLTSKWPNKKPPHNTTNTPNNKKSSKAPLRTIRNPTMPQKPQMKIYCFSSFFFFLVYRVNKEWKYSILFGTMNTYGRFRWHLKATSLTEIWIFSFSWSAEWTKNRSIPFCLERLTHMAGFNDI